MVDVYARKETKPSDCDSSIDKVRMKIWEKYLNLSENVEDCV